MQNVVRVPGLTCGRCGGADTASPCQRCSVWMRMDGAADRVLPLAYAIGGTQLRTELRTYKDPGAPQRSRLMATRTLSALMWSMSYHHANCLAAISYTEPSVVALVPSGRRDVADHPFESVARFADQRWTRTDAVRLYDIGRVCDPASVDFTHPRRLRGRHVVVVDDAWTTGAKAEGVAMAARQAGAVEVTIIPVGRIVNREYAPTSALREHLGSEPWRVDVCPATSGPCP